MECIKYSEDMHKMREAFAENKNQISFLFNISEKISDFLQNTKFYFDTILIISENFFIILSHL